MIYFFSRLSSMIKPTKKLLEFLDQFENQSRLSVLIGIDPAILSKIINDKQGATIGIIESVYKFNHWPINEAWEIADE